MKKIKSSVTTRTAMLMGLLLLYGCDSFVEVELPSSQLTAAAVFEEKGTANAAMTDIYSKLRDSGLLNGSGSGMSFALGLYADELDYYGAGSNDSQFFYTNSIQPDNGAVASWWSVSYNQVYAANTVYARVAASTKLAQADKDQLMGEALFTRALVHFYLVNIFGDIPYITTTDYRQNQVVQKLSVPEVYNHIIADLEAAQAFLPADYFGGQRVRPNRFVAKALLARVYLYNGNNAEAANAASAVINENAAYYFVSDFDTAFLKDSPSIIWQLIPQTAGSNTEEGANFIFTAGPPPFVALTPSLVTAFEVGDLRKVHWVKEVTNGSTSWYYVYKYKRQSATGSTEEYSVVLRLPEMYLIRAEARAKQGDLIGAKDDLNAIRNLAGLGNTPAVSQQDLLTAIQKERRVELFTESGHRFFDLKRSGEINNTLTVVKPGWNSTEALFPLPENELLLNPNLLPQNPGY